MNTTQRTERILWAGLLLAFLVVFLQTAWVGDDVFITLRTVDNFTHGFGLRWNVVERVQTYTHPLWMFAMIPVYALSRNAYLTAVILSLTFSLATLLVIAGNVSLEDAFPGLVVLLVSKAFIDFSVSGLENPATNLFLALFCFYFWKQDSRAKDSSRSILILSLLASLLALNRLDALLFVVPTYLFILYRNRSLKTLGYILLGFLPLILWEAFSLFYYGFPFPNTAYAKLNTGIPALALVRQALAYYADSFSRDPITLLATLAGMGLAFWKGNARERLSALGAVFYLLYILKIGGDFMSGRFFSAPLLVSVLLGMRLLRSAPMPLKYALAAVVLLVGLLTPYPTLLPHNDDQPLFTEQDLVTGIQDERGFYYHITGLLPYIQNGWKLPDNEGWIEHGQNLRQNKRKVVQEQNIGFMGYYAGPDVYLLDTYALGDPLLARLPIPDPSHWRIGHFERNIPNGYLETLRSGNNRIENPDLALYYDKLRLITRGPLLSRERLLTIWKMNMGQYDYLLHQ